MHHLITHTLFTTQAVGAAATLTGPVVNLQFARQLEGLLLKASSVAGTANVKAGFQTSPDGVSWDARADRADVIAASLTDRPGNAEGWNTYAMPAPLNRFFRLVLDEISAAGLTDTLVDAKLLVREEIGS